MTGLGPGLGTAQHRLARDARHVRAFAADAKLLNQRYRAALVRYPACYPLAGRARAEHHHVEDLHAQKVPVGLARPG